MEKVIKIGEIEKTFRANGATPIRYRKAFKDGDFFKDLISLQGIDLARLTSDDLNIISRIAFAMCEDSRDAGVNFEEWLEQFDIFPLLQSAPELVSLIVGNLATKETGGTSKNENPAES